MDWIKVDEQLPSVGVLVETKNDNVIGKCKLQSDGGWYLQITPTFGGLLAPDSYPTHWREIEDGLQRAD